MTQEEKIDQMTSQFLIERKHSRKGRNYKQRLSVCDDYNVDICQLLNKGATIYAIWQYLKTRRKLKISYSTVLRHIRNRIDNGEICQRK